MKKIILLILITFIGLFAFSFSVEALNSDATATCVYKVPNSDVTATFEYANVDLDSSCSTPKSNATTTYKCEIDTNINDAVFRDLKTDEPRCPTLYYSYDNVSTGNVERQTFKISVQEFKSSWLDLNFSPIASVGKMTLVSSNINKGSTKVPEAEETQYLQCICGDILIKRNSITFTFDVPIQNGYDPDGHWVNFNPGNFTSCPEAIYYKATGGFAGHGTIEMSDVEFSGSQAAACATTEEAASWYDGSSGNDTDYKPQEDKIADFCTETSRAWKVFGYLIMALKILVPIIIIVMGSLDLGKAVVANSEDEMKKATQVLIKRIIAGIIIFFIPTIINLVLKLASNYVNVVDSGSNCIECVSKPGSC